MGGRAVAPNKRFLRAVRDERVFVHIYNNSTRGITWRSLPFGMWFFLEHELAGYAQQITGEAPLPAKLYTEPGVLVLLTDKGRECLTALP